MVANKARIFFCYEKNCGGETNITENYINVLKKSRSIQISHHSLEPLKKTNLKNFLIWQFLSIFEWSKVIWQERGRDIIYVTTYTAGVAASIIRPFSKYKLLFHYHGNRIPPKNIEANFFYKLTHTIKYVTSHLLHTFFLQNCNLIIISTPYSKRKIVNSFPFLKNYGFSVIPNGVRMTKFKRNNNDNLKNKIGLPSNSMVILSIGRLNSKKRIINVVRVFKKVLSKTPNLYLVIAHPKPFLEEELLYKKKLLDEVNKLGITNKVLWKENPLNIPQLYWLSDLVLSFSEEENLSMTMIETLASGTIFASSTPGSTKSILKSIDEVLYIKNKNTVKQIRFLLNMPLKIKANLVKKSIAKVADFDINLSSKLLCKTILSQI